MRLPARRRPPRWCDGARGRARDVRHAVNRTSPSRRWRGCSGSRPRRCGPGTAATASAPRPTLPDGIDATRRRTRAAGNDAACTRSWGRSRGGGRYALATAQRASLDGRRRHGARAGGTMLRLPGAGRYARGLGRRRSPWTSRRAHRARRGDRRARRRDRLGRRRPARARGRGPALGDDRRGRRDRAPAQPERHRGVLRARRRAGRRARRPTGPARGMPREQHTLPLVVLAAALGDEGVPVRPLGTDLPGGARRGRAPHRAGRGGAVVAAPGDRRRRAAGRAAETRPRARTFVAGPRLGRGRPARAGAAARALVEAVDALVTAAR